MNESPKMDAPLARQLALALTIGAALWRLATLASVSWANFSPIMAIAFCAGAYFPAGWMWAAPFAAVSLTDIAIDRFYAASYHYDFSWTGAGIRLVCFAAGLAIGALVARRRSPLNLTSGILGASLLFYFVTNTASWFGDQAYMHNAAGWWQAMTVGHPEFPPTIFFFRNTLVSDLGFTGLFAAVMATAAARQRPQLATQR